MYSKKHKDTQRKKNDERAILKEEATSLKAPRAWKLFQRNKATKCRQGFCEKWSRDGVASLFKTKRYPRLI